MCKGSIYRRVFAVFNYMFCITVSLVCILPLIHILAVSFSSKQAVISGQVTLWPKDFTFDSYRFMMRDRQFFVSYFVTFCRVFLGWAINMTLIVLTAYPLSLSERKFPARPLFVWFFLFTMLFNGGMIPTYLVVESLGILDSIWALVLVGAVPVYNVILMMNFIKALPESLSEAAFLDGAGHSVTLTRVVLPLSKASIATVSLFVILGHWNAWFDGMIYIRSMNLKPLQTYLRSIIIVDSAVRDSSVLLEDIIANVGADSANAAKIFLALFPILCVYPFLQKHFTKGIVQGSLKD